MNVQNGEKNTLLSSRFCSASFPVISRISTFLGCEMSVCRSMTRSLLLPRHAESESKSRVLLSEEPSTGQKTPQNFCRGLAGLSEPMLLKKAGISPAVDMPRRLLVGFVSGTDITNLNCSYLFSFFLSLSVPLLSVYAPRTVTASGGMSAGDRSKSATWKIIKIRCAETLPVVERLTRRQSKWKLCSRWSVETVGDVGGGGKETLSATSPATVCPQIGESSKMLTHALEI